jgi:hypothetical protein
VLGVGDDQPPPPETWSGVVRIDGVRTVAGDLHLPPGTDVRLAAGASLVVHGRLHAEGTAAAPIRFRRADAAAAWGTVALQGRRASGSRLRHCAFDGGSGLASRDGRFEYSGMLSIHDAGDVLVAACAFERSSAVDDVVHAVYADVEFHGCRFGASPSDALDLDLCQATVADCSFADTGNDGIDLMSCDAIVHRCTFTRCGDKGVSVGERTRALVVECRFEDCARGVQAKDDSDALVGNCTVTGGQQALDALRKNWRYGTGGRLEAQRCLLLGAAAAPAADVRSRLVLRDCALDPAPAPAANLLLEDCDACPVAGGAAAARPLSVAIRGRQARAQAIWARLSGDTRGAP